MTSANEWQLKYHFWLSLLIGVVFLAILQTAVAPRFSPLKFSLWVVFFGALVFFYNREYLKLLNQYTVYKALRIPLLIGAGAAAFSAEPSPFTRAIFLLSSIVVVAVYESALASFAENILLNESLFTAFGWFVGLGSWAYFYTPQYRFFFSLVTFGFIFLLSRCFFEYAPVGEKSKLVSSLAVSLLVSEFFWVLGLLPQHFTVLALSLTALYYVCLIINYHFLFNNLDFKKIQFHIIFAGACIVLAFLFTPWRVIG